MENDKSAGKIRRIILLGQAKNSDLHEFAERERANLIFFILQFESATAGQKWRKSQNIVDEKSKDIIIELVTLLK